MSASAETIAESYRLCRRFSTQAGSNFHAGFWLLKRDKRRAMEALYAFMRQTDDLADAPGSDGLPRDALTGWRAALVGALANESDPSADDPSGVGAAILPAVADTVRRFHIPHDCLYAVIDGVEMDLTPRRYESFDELRPYCERVASAVGLACIHIWGFRGPEAFEPARKCGIAMQLTNILRDLKEDLAADRLYLPLADLRECGYSVEDLRAGAVNEAFSRLMAMEIDRAEQFYAESAELIDYLEPAGRRIFGWMTASYRALLREIARRPAAVLRQRVRLTRAQKLSLALRWTLLPPRKAALQ